MDSSSGETLFLYIVQDQYTNHLEAVSKQPINTEYWTWTYASYPDNDAIHPTENLLKTGDLNAEPEQCDEHPSFILKDILLTIYNHQNKVKLWIESGTWNLQSMHGR